VINLDEGQVTFGIGNGWDKAWKVVTLVVGNGWDKAWVKAVTLWISNN
jgi:hypothetical protein